MRAVDECTDIQNPESISLEKFSEIVNNEKYDFFIHEFQSYIKD